jgi:hypothetical protein
VGLEGSISVADFDILTCVVFVVTVTVVFCSIPSMGESLGSDGGFSSWSPSLKDSGNGGLGVRMLGSSDRRLAGKGNPGSAGLCNEFAWGVVEVSDQESSFGVSLRHLRIAAASFRGPHGCATYSI